MNKEISITKKTTMEIKAQYHEQQFGKIKTNLQFYISRFKNLDLISKTFTLTILTQINDDEKVLFLIQEELRDDYLDYCEVEILKHQAILAQAKLKYCSEKKCLEIAKKILYTSKKRSDISLNDKKFILNILCNIFQSLYEYEYLLESIELYSPTSPYNHLDFYIKLSNTISTINYNYLSNGETGDINELLNLEKDPILNNLTIQYIYKLHLVSFYWLHEIANPQFFYFLKSSRKNAPKTHLSWHCIMLAMQYVNLKQFKKALILIKSAYTNSNSLPEKIMCLYIMTQLGYSKIDISEIVFLNCSPLKSVYSYFLGNRAYQDYRGWLFPVIKKLQVLAPHSRPSNCWVIGSKTFKHTSYFNLNLKSYDQLIDLVSGVVISNKTKTLILTETKQKFLSLIIASGKFGIHITSLIDQMYDGEFIYINSAVLRMKNMLIELRKLGFPIIRENNYLRYDFENNYYSIIISVFHKNFTPFVFIANTFKQNNLVFLDRKNLSQALSIQPSTASKYIRTWKDKGFIYSDISCKNGQYKIIENYFKM